MTEALRNRLQGKRCLITGGSRGLGRAMVLRFLDEGASVAFTYHRNDDDAQRTLQLAERHSERVFAVKADSTSGVAVRAAVEQVVLRWGGVDVLVNNAGRTQVLPIGLIEEDDWDDMMAVHCKGSFLFSRACLRPMIRAKKGVILNIGTFASNRMVDAPVHYAAAKAALRGMTEALALEVGRYNIRVNLLAPGLLDVGLAQVLPKHRLLQYTKQTPSGRVGRAEELAELAAFMVSDESSFMTGAKLSADGGL